jgi:hypothetical protein
MSDSELESAYMLYKSLLNASMLNAIMGMIQVLREEK